MADVLRFKSTGEARDLLEQEKQEFEELDARLRANERAALQKRRKDQLRRDQQQQLQHEAETALRACDAKDRELVDLELLQVQRNRQIAEVQQQVQLAAKAQKEVEAAQQRRAHAEQRLFHAQQEANDLREDAMRPKPSPDKGHDEALRAKRSELEELRQLQQEGQRLVASQRELAELEQKLHRETQELKALEHKVLADPQAEERELKALEGTKIALERKLDYLRRGA